MSNIDLEWYNHFLKETDNVDLRKRKDMSFVAIAFLKGHIVGMADRRSTNYIADVAIQDPDREEVTKIWSNNKMVLALTGSNCIFMDDPENTNSVKKIFLEDLMKDMIKQYNDPEILCNDLYDYFRKNSYSESGSITAISFYQQNEDIYSLYCMFDTRHFEMKKTLHTDFAYLTAGNWDYQKNFIKHNNQLLTLDRNKLEKNLDVLIQDYEKENPDQYNPVGNGWNIVKIPDD